MLPALVPRSWLSIFALLAFLPPAPGNPRKAESAFRAGNRFFDTAHFSEAVEMYSLALQQDPKNPTLCYNRALANEMVDRKAAIRDWREFLGLVGDNRDWNAAASRLRERVQTLEQMPSLPDSLQVSQYLPKAGDYFPAVALHSKGLQFSKFPVEVFVGSVPGDWQRSTREALENWSRVVPLHVVVSREAADILLTWGTSTMESHRAGREQDLVQVERNEEGTIVKRRSVAFVTLDSSHHWSEGQKRATIMRELGHALGIQGHSDQPRDVMFGTIRDVSMVSTPQQPFSPPDYGPAPWNLPLPRRPSQRDVNTLIRLYNSPGLLKRLE